jgi:glycosyltransferase involved in cell wall biosynthesis
MIETSEPGGAETVLANIASRLDSSVYESEVVMLERDWLDRKLDALGVKYRVVPNERSYDPKFLWQMVRLVRREKFNIIHAHEFMMTVYGAVVGRLTGVPMIGTMHGKNYYPDKTSRRRFLRLALSMSSRLVAVSQDLEKFIARTINVNGHRKLLTLYNGIDVGKYAKGGDCAALRQAFSIPTQAAIGITVGALFKVKGLTHLLDALADIGVTPETFCMLIVGDGDQADPLKDQARKVGLTEVVRFTGFRDDVPELLSLADFYVCSSLSEGLSLAIMEAMAVGKPVIATNVGGNPELIADGESGFLVPPRDTKALGARIDEFIANRAMIKPMGDRGRTIARERFSLEVMIHNYQNLYQAVLQR